MSDRKTEALYLEWCNDFLTIEVFAEYHQMSVARATDIIKKGRKINNRRSE